MTRLRSTLVEFEALQPDGSTHAVQVNPRFIAAVCEHSRYSTPGVHKNDDLPDLAPSTLIQMAGGCTEHIVKGTVEEVAEKLVMNET
jgi:hypothetical protein